jgi:hypothetical protein
VPTSALAPDKLYSVLYKTDYPPMMTMFETTLSASASAEAGRAREAGERVGLGGSEREPSARRYRHESGSKTPASASSTRPEADGLARRAESLHVAGTRQYPVYGSARSNRKDPSA